MTKPRPFIRTSNSRTSPQLMSPSQSCKTARSVLWVCGNPGQNPPQSHGPTHTEISPSKSTSPPANWRKVPSRNGRDSIYTNELLHDHWRSQPPELVEAVTRSSLFHSYSRNLSAPLNACAQMATQRPQSFALRFYRCAGMHTRSSSLRLQMIDVVRSLNRAGVVGH